MTDQTTKGQKTGGKKTRGLIETLISANASQRLFKQGDVWITAGDIRAMAAGVRLPDGPIFLHTRSASRFTAGLLAAAAAHKTVALPAHTQPIYLSEIDCPPDALITDASFDRPSDQTGDQTGDPQRDPQALDNAATDPLLIVFTSGSTGKPKPVDKNLSRLEIEAAALDAAWGAEAGHVVATVSHQHIYGLIFRVIWPLLSGRTGDDEAAIYWEELEGRLAGATLVSSPAHLTRLPPRPDLFAPPPALIFSSGQLLMPEAAQDCLRIFGKPVTEVLGSTETGGIAWRRQSEPDAPWTPFPNIAMMRGAEDALIVRSPYLQTDAPHHTGDTIVFEGDGHFRLAPRGDRVAKIEGRRVSLTRIEAALNALPDIDAVAALTLPDRKGALAAIVTLTTDGKAKLQELGAFRLSRHLRAAAAATLEPTERPKHWRFLETIPADSQGKRVLSTLRSQFGAANPLDALDLDVRAHTDTDAEIAFTLAPELIFFEGHFRERAILPGVAQAHLAVLIAQKLWGDWPSDAHLARLKFRRVLLPGDKVVLKLKHDAQLGRVAFVYRIGEIDASQGEIGGFTR